MSELTANHIPGAPVMKLVPALPRREWMEGAKRCLPIRIANEAGWWILNPTRFKAVWTGEEHELGVQVAGPGGERPRKHDGHGGSRDTARLAGRPAIRPFRSHRRRRRGGGG